VIERVLFNQPTILRNPWENGLFLLALLEQGETLNSRWPGSGQPYIDFDISVAESHNWGQLPEDCSTFHGDCTNFAQWILELCRITPESEPRREKWMATLENPMAFAKHALRDSPATAPPSNPEWTKSGYGSRRWVDDMYTILPWLAAKSSNQEGMPADPTARDLTYEFLESYIYDHRSPDSNDPAELALYPVRRGFLLWNPYDRLWQHDPSTIGTDDYWGRGNGWAIYGLARTLQFLDRPYGGSGNQYNQVPTKTELEEIFIQMAWSLKDRRNSEGGWGTHLSLSHIEECPATETSVTGLNTYALAWGVNAGLLPKEVFVPVVLQASTLLQGKIDENGNVFGIQPSGGSPSCAIVSSNDPGNFNYGVGALLLANFEVAKFCDEDLSINN
jgi:hypothetical protein